MRDPLPAPTVAFHPAATRRLVEFGPFTFDWQDRTLRREGQEVRVPPRALAILALLLERPGRVVGKQELLDAVWKDSFVSESSLTEAIGVLRQTLGDTAAQPVYIQTVHRRGYRFVAPIDVDAGGSLTAPRAPGQDVTPVTARSQGWFPVGLWIGATAALVVGALAWWLWPDSAATRVTRATITLPESIAPAPGLSNHTVADVSPDGRRVVYVAGSTGSYRLYLRALDRFDATPIAGTEGAHGAFFAPSGDRIGFFRGGRLFVTRIPDGEPLELAAVGAGFGGWWHTDGTIYAATGRSTGIVRVNADGGRATTVPTGSFDPATLRQPSVMPDGRTLLATRWRLTVRQSEVVAIDLDSGQARVLSRGVHPRPLGSTHVALLQDGHLVAVPLSGEGAAIPLLSGVMTGVRGSGQYSLSAEGTLLYLPDAPARSLRRLIQITGDGGDTPVPLEPRAYQNVAVSPEGQRVAVTIYEQGASDLWVGDLSRGTLVRLTSEGGSIEPVWSPDARTLYFASSRTGQYRLYRIAADGSGVPSLVGDLSGAAPTAATDTAVMAQRLGDSGDDLVWVDLATGAVTDWLATPDHEARGRVSPDRRWVTFESNRTGRTEVYLRAIGGGPAVQLSTDGGTSAIWTADSRSVRFLSRQRLMQVGLVAGTPGVPALVRADPAIAMTSPRGQDLIAILTLEEARPLTTLHVVVNWLSEARALLGR